MKLSILMSAITNRNAYNLISKLNNQATEDVEILILMDNKKETLSNKRNKLIQMCKGEYICFADDDDNISDDYVSSLLEGIKLGTDVVNFNASISIDGEERKDVLYSKEYDNEYRDGIYYRKPNHIMCRRKELSKQFPYLNIPEEDTDYANRICDSIKTEYNIDKTLYYYDFSSEGSECLGTEHYNENRRV